jgi:hypothetical protein
MSMQTISMSKIGRRTATRVGAAFGRQMNAVRYNIVGGELECGVAITSLGIPFWWNVAHHYPARGARDVLGEALEICSIRPMAWFYRDGWCDSRREDLGNHTVCAVMTSAFLEFSNSRGNDATARVWPSRSETW